MQKIRYGIIVMSMLLCSVTSATAQVSIGIGLPNVSIGINLPLFPELVPVPGYPVYYAPRIDANYFFYDGLYWVYQDDTWYASSWYNGPWGFVEPEVVPLFILRVPVRYYRQPPVYFRGWAVNAPPRWGQHWGHGWEQRRSGWNRWNRSSVPARAPLPVYQRQYTGDRYPRHIEQQHSLRSRSYRYQPRDKAVRQHLRQVEQKAPAPAQRGRQERPPTSPRNEDARHSPPRQQGGEIQKTRPDRPAPQQRAPEVGNQDQRQRPGTTQREQQAPRAQDRGERQDRGDSRDQGRGHGQGQKNDGERGR